MPSRSARPSDAKSPPKSSTAGTNAAAGSPLRLKPLVTAISFAAITIVGTLYGADLKTSTQQQKTTTLQQAADNADHIRQLEGARSRLYIARDDILKKMDVIHKRRAANTINRPE